MNIKLIIWKCRFGFPLSCIVAVALLNGAAKAAITFDSATLSAQFIANPSVAEYPSTSQLTAPGTLGLEPIPVYGVTLSSFFYAVQSGGGLTMTLTGNESIPASDNNVNGAAADPLVNASFTLTDPTQYTLSGINTLTGDPNEVHGGLYVSITRSGSSYPMLLDYYNFSGGSSTVSNPFSVSDTLPAGTYYLEMQLSIGNGSGAGLPPAQSPASANGSLELTLGTVPEPSILPMSTAVVAGLAALCSSCRKRHFRRSSQTQVSW